MECMVQNASADIHGQFTYIPPWPGQPQLPLPHFPVNFLDLQKLVGNYKSYVYIIRESY